jgi:hypothetical protein
MTARSKTTSSAPASSSANSRRAACSGSSATSISPFGTDKPLPPCCARRAPRDARGAPRDRARSGGRQRCRRSRWISTDFGSAFAIWHAKSCLSRGAFSASRAFKPLCDRDRPRPASPPISRSPGQNLLIPVTTRDMREDESLHSRASPVQVNPEFSFRRTLDVGIMLRPA